MTLFQGKYRIESIRLKGWDYTSPGEYFVTICTKGMVEWFGRVNGNVMQMNDIGDVARRCWIEIPQHHTDIALDEFIVMPNHVHGIIVINEHHGENRRDVAGNVSTGTTPSISPKSGSLSAIIRSYKSAVTNWCAKHGYDDFTWQPRFYDHIIRNDKSLNTIREYIRNNPAHWESDRNQFSQPTD
jgi:REP element-mobilizing transposase RayT